MTEALHLVACVKRKLPHAAQAKDLYMPSHWFTLARRYVEAQGGPWFILSAKHGLVHPQDWLEPYDDALRNMNAIERGQWAYIVRRRMDRMLPDDVDRVVVLAGKRYREHLLPYLGMKYRGRVVDVPMVGLGIGKQLRFLTRAI